MDAKKKKNKSRVRKSTEVIHDDKRKLSQTVSQNDVSKKTSDDLKLSKYKQSNPLNQGISNYQDQSVARKSQVVIGRGKRKLSQMTDQNDDGSNKASDDSKRRKHKLSNSQSNQDSKATDAAKNINAESFRNRRKIRRTAKPSAELIAEAKTLWGKIRMHKTDDDKRKGMISSLLVLMDNNLQEFTLKHDTVRIVQCCLKFGNKQQRNDIYQMLQGQIVQLSQSKYSKFLVKKMLQCGTKMQRDEIIKAFYGHVRKLMRHKEASEILEILYNNHATAVQRSALIEEFYGPEYAVFKSNTTRTLADIVAAEPNKKTKILNYMHATLMSLLDRDVIKHSIIHRVLLEYFNHAEAKLKSEMIEALRDILIHILHTNEGSKITMHCIWNGTPKDRKCIVKSMKKYVSKICREDYGHYSLLAIFDAVDDTVLVRKAILSEVISDLDEIFKNPKGKKILLYLLAARDTKYFHPDVIKILEEGDDNLHSKKDIQIRRKELLEGISKPLVDYITLNIQELIVDSSSALLIMAVVENALREANLYFLNGYVVDVTDLLKAIAVLANKELHSDEEKKHIVSNPMGHVVLKNLIKSKRGKDEDGKSFDEILLDTVSSSVLHSWIKTNRGCFILVSLMESSSSTSIKLRNILMDIKQDIKEQSTKGCSILYKLLNK